jgi:hypothetical protein
MSRCLKESALARTLESKPKEVKVNQEVAKEISF